LQNFSTIIDRSYRAFRVFSTFARERDELEWWAERLWLTVVTIDF
jgi:hypothetical protein